MKIFTGIVVSTKAAKTAHVSVERIVAHPIYKKRMKKTRKYPVHDEIGVQVGQSVRFVACKPISKTKKWKIIEVVVSKNENIKKTVVKRVDTTAKVTRKGKK